MKKIYKTLIFAGLLSSFVSCDYLDIVPKETATEEDAFASEDAAERYLYSCYGYMPAHQNTHINCDFAGDEIVSCFPGEPIKLYFEGGYTSSNLGGVEAVYQNMYKGIRQCYLLKTNIDKVPGMAEGKKSDYINQVDFLIAYYHMNLMKNYGPIVLVKDLPDMGVSYEKMAARSPYDECVEWVAGEFERLSGVLPAHREGTEYGFATSVAAKALRSRLLLYAASPLFNGNSEYYSDFVNHDGTQLISQEFSADKYVRAADAALEAINFAESNGYNLYKLTGDDALISEAPYPTDKIQRQLRLVYTDKRGSTEVLWANTRNEEMYSLQNKSLPFRAFGGGYGPSLTMIERFYTENGLPINEDPDFYESSEWYGTDIMNDDTKGNGITLNLHFNREPRFYSWISFHNGFYECGAQGNYVADGKEGCPQASKDMSNKKKLRWLTQYKKNDNCGRWSRTNNYSPTGYLNKKGVHPAIQIRTGDGAPTQKYPIPIIRLGELYLNYAEACVGSRNQALIEKGMAKLNEIRERAGISPVLTSWAKAKHPLTSYSDPDRLMEIVKQERMIELYMEGHNFWDLRRWKMGEYLNKKQRGLNVDGTTDATFLQPVELGNVRRFATPMNYLMPIPVDEVSTNPQMVQNPKY